MNTTTDLAPRADNVNLSFRASNRGELTEQELAILKFEKRWWRHAGAKEAAARSQFGVSATSYYQQLNRVLDKPAAQAVEPALVKRLRNVRGE